VTFRVRIEEEARDNLRSHYRSLQERYGESTYPLEWYRGIRAAIQDLASSAERFGTAYEDRYFQEHIRQRLFDSYKVLFTIRGSVVHVLPACPASGPGPHRDGLGHVSAPPPGGASRPRSAGRRPSGGPRRFTPRAAVRPGSAGPGEVEPPGHQGSSTQRRNVGGPAAEGEGSTPVVPIQPMRHVPSAPSPSKR
jgi:hypothetical protein